MSVRLKALDAKWFCIHFDVPHHRWWSLISVYWEPNYFHIPPVEASASWGLLWHTSSQLTDVNPRYSATQAGTTSIKNLGISRTLKPRLHYTWRDATRLGRMIGFQWNQQDRSHYAWRDVTRRDGTRLRRPNWLLYPNNRAESRSKRDSLGFRHQRNPFPRIVTRLTRLV